jgi:hypothetical protein
MAQKKTIRKSLEMDSCGAGSVVHLLGRHDHYRFTGSLQVVELNANESIGTTIKISRQDLNHSYRGLQVEEGAGLRLEEKHGTCLQHLLDVPRPLHRKRFVSVYGKVRSCPYTYTVCRLTSYKGVHPFYLFSHLLKHSKPTARRPAHASRSDFAESVYVLCTSRYVKRVVYLLCLRRHSKHTLRTRARAPKVCNRISLPIPDRGRRFSGAANLGRRMLIGSFHVPLVKRDLAKADPRRFFPWIIGRSSCRLQHGSQCLFV